MSTPKRTVTVPIRFDMTNLERRHRITYRYLRSWGFPRRDANMIVCGMVLEARGGDLGVSVAGDITDEILAW